MGSPFSIKYGGKEIGDSADAFAQVVASTVKIAEAISVSAGLEASFKEENKTGKEPTFNFPTGAQTN